MALAQHLKNAIFKAAGKYKAKHPKHSKRGAASRGEDAEYSQESEASHAESGVVVGHPKQGKNSKKGMDSDYEPTTRGNKGKVVGTIKNPKIHTKGIGEEYEGSYEDKSRNAKEKRGRVAGKAGKF